MNYLLSFIVSKEFGDIGIWSGWDLLIWKEKEIGFCDNRGWGF